MKLIPNWQTHCDQPRTVCGILMQSAAVSVMPNHLRALFSMSIRTPASGGHRHSVLIYGIDRAASGIRGLIATTTQISCSIGVMVNRRTAIRH